MQLFPLSMMAGWRSRHFTAVAGLGPEEIVKAACLQNETAPEKLLN